MTYITTKQAAELLGVSERRVRAKIKQGHFPNAKGCGCEKNNWLISSKDIEKIKNEKTQTHHS